MTAKVTGRADVSRYLNGTAKQRLVALARGALREAAKVTKAEAARGCASNDVADALRITTPKTDEGRVVVRIVVDGNWARSVATWLEYGTSPHIITVSDDQRRGRSVNTINRNGQVESLKINGAFVGGTVAHKGARPYPFLRPALDVSENAAMRAAQAYLNRRGARRR